MRSLIVDAVMDGAPLSAQTVTADPTNHSVTSDMRTLPLHIGGRVQATPLPPPMPKGATDYRHEPRGGAAIHPRGRP